MQNLIETYRKHLLILGYETKTIKGQAYYLNRFVSYLSENNIAEIVAVTKEVIRDYQTHLYEEINKKTGQPNSVCIQNKNMGAVKTFFRFLSENDYLVGDPAKNISYAKEPQKLPRSILTKSEARKLIHTPDTKKVLGYRDRTILEVLYSAGIRKEEIRNILLSDVDYQDGIIRVNLGKGKKDRF